MIRAKDYERHKDGRQSSSALISISKRPIQDGHYLSFVYSGEDEVKYHLADFKTPRRTSVTAEVGNNYSQPPPDGWHLAERKAPAVAHLK